VRRVFRDSATDTSHEGLPLEDVRMAPLMDEEGSLVSGKPPHCLEVSRRPRLGVNGQARSNPRRGPSSARSVTTYRSYHGD
jgi:hypothetical protein